MTESCTTAAEAPAGELLRLPATELVARLRSREIGAAELLTAVLERADAITPSVNPFSVRLDEQAVAAAAESDRRLAAGEARPLEGLPVSIKDSQWLAGVRSSLGSRATADFVPDRTVGAVHRLLDAGAVVFATTTTSEFCYTGVSHAPLFGSTGNPHDLGRTAGGSSGGAAAQVAAWAGPVAMGGDGGGSIRIPAAFCGVVGFKPTHGVVSHEPSGASWKTLVAVGPLTRTVADAALVHEVVAHADPLDGHAVPQLPRPDGPVRIAVSPDLGFAALDDGVRARFAEAVAALVEAGVDVVEEHPVRTSAARTWSMIATAEARWANEAYERDPELLSPSVRDYLAFGEAVTAADYVRAQFEREEIHAAYARFFAHTGVDALFTPTLGCVAFDGGVAYPAEIGGVAVEEPWRDWAPLLYDANLAGLPAASVPIGYAGGLPVGGQLIGPRRADRAVLRAAEVVERALIRNDRP